MSFGALWESLLPLGRDPGTGGYRRFSWTGADAACREWFTATAGERALPTRPDRNGNLWAWWDPRPGPAALPAVVTGSHLDSVPDGGAFDGPLGIVSAFAAIDLLRARGFVPARPVAVAAFTEEEGARFGMACLGSRLLAGTVDPGTARALRDRDGITLADAMAAAGHDPQAIGPEGDLLASIGGYVELHIEQGSALVGLGAPVGVADRIWPHGRWLLEFTGQPDHAGTASLAGRRDPMLPFAATVLAARAEAAARDARATIGRVIAEPGGVNAVSSRVRAWLDARAGDEAALAGLVEAIAAAAHTVAAAHRVGLLMRRESVTPGVSFDPALRARVLTSLAARGITAPVLATGAGHDAGTLATAVPTAMLFVRNPTGISHSPAEHADTADCEAGVEALAAVLEDLTCQ